MTWITRQVEHGYKLHKHAFAIVDKVEEKYLRTDISCGSPICKICHSKSQLLPASASHYVIPDALTLQSLIEIFELPDFEGCIFLTSVLQEIQRKGNPRLNARLRSLINDSRRGITVFDNLHCLFTAPTLQERCSGVDILKAAQFYRDHLDHRIGIVVLAGGQNRAFSTTENLHVPESPMESKDHKRIKPQPESQEIGQAGSEGDDVLDELLGLSLGNESESGPLKIQDTKDAQKNALPRIGDEVMPHKEQEVMSPGKYFSRFWTDNERIQELAESLISASGLSRASPSKLSRHNKALYAEHHSAAAIKAGLQSGTLVQGVLQTSARKRGEAYVQLADGQSIYLSSKKAINRALHGDKVAVKICAGKAANKQKNFHVQDKIPSQEEDVLEANELGDPSADEFSDSEPSEDRAVAQKIRNVESTTSGRNLEGVGNVPLQLCGEVVGIVHAVPRDLVACIDEDDESTITATGKRESVLCIPLDRRMPKMRLKSTRMQRLIGQRFVVRLDDWSASASFPSCHLIRILGPLSDLRSSTEAILANVGVEESAFSKGAMDELPRLASPGDWQVPESEVKSRRDLRGEEYMICSIDPPGCTDVDDCLSVRVLEDRRTEIGVHIADVSFFVPQGSHLDAEGSARGTTVYLVDRRLDMLPSLLSEHLCSLREGQDRLAVSVIWTLTPQFDVADIWSGRTIIRSKHQLAYKQAQDILDGVDSPSAQQIPKDNRKHLQNQFQVLLKAANNRKERRQKDGALELESTELSFETSAEGQSQVLNKEVVPMMGVVAEMMIWANETVAQKLVAGLPSSALVRRHPPPPVDAFHEIADLCEELGVSLDVSTPSSLSTALRKVIKSADDSATANLIKALATRAMREAEYVSTGDNRVATNTFGHFGLGLKHYTHFTSPIRRYADVVVHRQLLAVLGYSQRKPMDHSKLSAATEVMNEQTRRAKVAQRECTNLFFLASVERTPQLERALVVGISDTALQLYLPKFGMRITLHLLDKNGAVRPLIDKLPERNVVQVVNDKDNNYKIHSDGGSMSVFNVKKGRSELTVGKLGKVWVSVTSVKSRNHGFVLQVSLIRNDTQGMRNGMAVQNGPTRRQLISAEADLKLKTDGLASDSAKEHLYESHAPLHHLTLLDQFNAQHEQTEQVSRRKRVKSLANVIEDVMQTIASEQDDAADRILNANEDCEDKSCVKGGNFGVDGLYTQQLSSRVMPSIVDGNNAYLLEMFWTYCHLLALLTAHAMRRDSHQLNSSYQASLDKAKLKAICVLIVL